MQVICFEALSPLDVRYRAALLLRPGGLLGGYWNQGAKQDDVLTFYFFLRQTDDRKVDCVSSSDKTFARFWKKRGYPPVN